MIPRKRLNPLKRREDRNENKKSEDNFYKGDSHLNQSSINKNVAQQEPIEIPEFLKRVDNEQYLQLYIRMRQRHFADGAVSINVESDDIADQMLELYDNKGINVEPPSLNEHLADHVEYYMESFNRDKFMKISKSLYQQEKDKPKPEEKKIEKKIQRTTEEELFRQFDSELSHIIVKTSEKVSLIFLFAQGLLAGISLVNILLLLEYSNYSSFLLIYSNNVREIFNFTHSLTFGSLVGNGIKFISTYKRYKINQLQFVENKKAIKSKRSMIISGSIFVLFTITFGLLLYLASYVPLILYSKYTKATLISQSEFQTFSALYSAANIIAILNFILNIFDVNVAEDKEMTTEPEEEFDPDETRETSFINI